MSPRLLKSIGFGLVFGVVAIVLIILIEILFTISAILGWIAFVLLIGSAVGLDYYQSSKRREEFHRAHGGLIESDKQEEA